MSNGCGGKERIELKKKSRNNSKKNGIKIMCKDNSSNIGSIEAKRKSIKKQAMARSYSCGSNSDAKKFN